MSWHIEGCTGACLACLIEETVRQHYGTQGLDYLRRKVGAECQSKIAQALGEKVGADNTAEFAADDISIDRVSFTDAMHNAGGKRHE